MLTSLSFSDPNQSVLRSTTSINSSCSNNANYVLRSTNTLATCSLPASAYAEPRFHIPAYAFNDCRKPSYSGAYICSSAAPYSHGSNI